MQLVWRGCGINIHRETKDREKTRQEGFAWLGDARNKARIVELCEIRTEIKSTRGTSYLNSMLSGRAPGGARPPGLKLAAW